MVLIHSNPFKSLVERCKAFVRQKRQTVVMPSALFLHLFHEIELQYPLPTPIIRDF